MPVFFAEESAVGPDGELELRDDLARRLTKVLRLRPGEEIRVVLRDGLERRVRLGEVSPDLVRGRVLQSLEPGTEPRTPIHLAQAIPKGSGMAEVCERVSELGARSIWPLVTERTIVRPSPATADVKVRHWRAVAVEAAELAGRSAVPEVHRPLPLVDALAELGLALPDLQILVCHHADDAAALGDLRWSPDRPTVVVIGPEGGWAPAELELVRGAGALVVSLGPRNLRTVLAGLVAVTILLGRGGDLEPRSGVGSA